MSVTNSTALIDGDILAYKAACVSQDDYDWDDEGAERYLNTERASEVIHELVEFWKDCAHAKKAVIAFSDRSPDRKTFRHKLWPGYKANRKKQEKPELLEFCLGLLQEEYKTFTMPGLEGDDVLGILQTSGMYKNSVIVSIDKDMRCIPGKFVRPYDTKPANEHEVENISAVMADKHTATQVLTGDTGDGIKGAFKIGPKKAEPIVNAVRYPNARTLYDAVLATYMDIGKVYDVELGDWREGSPGEVEQFCLLTYRLCYILRHGDYVNNKSVKLWLPERNGPWMEVA